MCRTLRFRATLAVNPSSSVCKGCPECNRATHVLEEAAADEDGALSAQPDRQLLVLHRHQSTTSRCLTHDLLQDMVLAVGIGHEVHHSKYNHHVLILTEARIDAPGCQAQGRSPAARCTCTCAARRRPPSPQPCAPPASTKAPSRHSSHHGAAHADPHAWPDVTHVARCRTTSVQSTPCWCRSCAKGL